MLDKTQHLQLLKDINKQLMFCTCPIQETEVHPCPAHDFDGWEFSCVSTNNKPVFYSSQAAAFFNGKGPIPRWYSNIPYTAGGSRTIVWGLTTESRDGNRLKHSPSMEVFGANLHATKTLDFKRYISLLQELTALAASLISGHLGRVLARMQSKKMDGAHRALITHPDNVARIDAHSDNRDYITGYTKWLKKTNTY